MSREPGDDGRCGIHHGIVEVAGRVPRLGVSTLARRDGYAHGNIHASPSVGRERRIASPGDPDRRFVVGTGSGALPDHEVVLACAPGSARPFRVHDLSAGEPANSFQPGPCDPIARLVGATVRAVVPFAPAWVLATPAWDGGRHRRGDPHPGLFSATIRLAVLLFAVVPVTKAQPERRHWARRVVGARRRGARQEPGASCPRDDAAPPTAADRATAPVRGARPHPRVAARRALAPIATRRGGRCGRGRNEQEVPMTNTPAALVAASLTLALGACDREPELTAEDLEAAYHASAQDIVTGLRADGYAADAVPVLLYETFAASKLEVALQGCEDVEAQPSEGEERAWLCDLRLTRTEPGGTPYTPMGDTLARVWRTAEDGLRLRELPPEEAAALRPSEE